MKMLLPIARTLDRLAADELTSSCLVKACLETIANPAGEGSLTFVRLTAGATAAIAGCAIHWYSPGTGIPILA